MKKVMRVAKLALEGGKPAITRKAPRWPVSGNQEVKWMTEVVRSGAWSWIGKHERAFCEEYRKFIGTKYCLCLANGTVTMQCALQAVGVKPGDEVIVPAMTWVATAQAALDVGANVVLVDVDPETLCISPKAIEAAITKKTRAIMPVHLYGCMADMDAIMKIARKHKLKVVEDVAHQHGSQWRGKGAGAIGDVGSYSFQQSKILTSGEGGAITCNSPDVYSTIFALKQVGWTVADPEKARYDKLVPGNRYGHNYRMTEMQAVLLRGGLSRLKAQNALREKNAAFLARELKKIGGPLRVARRDPRVTRQAMYCLTMHFDPKKAGGVTRGMYMKALAAEKFACQTPYDPVYRHKLLNLYDSTSPVPFRDPRKIQNYGKLKLPVTERACTETAIVMPHTRLLGDRAYMKMLVSAVARVNASLPAVKRHFEKEAALAKKK